jgi:DNA-binding Xre family transcriptional regulator
MAKRKKAKKKQVPKVPKQGKPKLRIVRAEIEKNAPVHWKRDDWTYFRDLHKIIDAVYQVAADEHDWTWGQLADNANLAYATVAKLGDRETRWPRFQTIYKLCHAVGWELVQIQTKKKRKAPALKKVS